MQSLHSVLASICLTLLLVSSVAVSAAEPKKKISDSELKKAVVEYNKEISDADDEVVCKNKAVTGSRKKVRVCKTRGTIKAEREEARRLRNRKSGATNPSAGGGGNVQ
jgi:hypothetical protein